MSWGLGAWGTTPWGGLTVDEDDTQPNLAGAETQAAKQQDRLLGQDILFTFDGELPVGSKGDFMLIGGLDNLRQAIYRRLITRPGEYKFVPSYGVGVPSYLKQRRTQTNLKQLEARIRENLLRERRIEQVVDVSIENITDGIKVNIAVKAAGRFLRFRPFEFSEEQS